MLNNGDRFFLTKRTKRRLRSLAITVITVAVIAVAGLTLIRRERAPAHPVTPAETDWARRAQPLLVAVDRIFNRHDALAATAAATGRPALRPTAALRASIQATLRRMRKLSVAPVRLRPFRSESIDTLTDALQAYGDYAAAARTGNETILTRADRGWAVALGDQAHLDQLVATAVVPSAIKPARAQVNLVVYEAALAASQPQLRAAKAVEAALLAEVRANRGSAAAGPLANRSAAVFSALSVQASSLPTGDNETSRLNLGLQNALHHAVLGANDVIAALQNSDMAQLKRGVKAFVTGNNTYRRFLHDLSGYGAQLTAAAAAAR